MKENPDFSVIREGNIFLVHAENENARDWLNENVGNSVSWAGSLVVDQHYVADLVYGIQSAGFIVV